jgi:uncharacterized protein
MSIIDHPDWDLSERGMKDAQRHREKIDDAIRKNVRDVIADESIITKKHGKKVRVPVKGLKDFKFIYDTGKSGAGVGQGKGKPGDVIYKRDKSPGQGEPDDKNKGSGDMDVEVDIDYLIKVMFDELGLPYIEEKTKVETLVPKGWKFDAITKKGIYPRLHKKRTIIEAIKRTSMDAGEVQEATNCDIDDAFRALIQANHDIVKAIEVVKSGKLDKSIDPDDGLFTIDDDDLRYRQIEESFEMQSNAVVIAMMDISGSMTKEKKYLTRSLLFWLTQFLRKVYENVKIKFIVHTTEAKIVAEDEFFNRESSGGTQSYTAFELAEYLIDSEFSPEEWNIYIFYSSDGEDFDPKRTISTINRLVDRKVNMIAYAEVNPDVEEFAGWWQNNNLIKVMKKSFKFLTKKIQDTEFYKDAEKHIVAGLIKNRNHVWPMLSHMLFERKK